MFSTGSPTNTALPADLRDRQASISAGYEADLQARGKWEESLRPQVDDLAGLTVQIEAMNAEMLRYVPGSKEYLALARRIERARGQSLKLISRLGLSAAARAREGRKKDGGESLVSLLREAFEAEGPAAAPDAEACPWSQAPACYGPTGGGGCLREDCPARDRAGV